MNAPDWIAADWDGVTLDLWAMQGASRVASRGLACALTTREAFRPMLMNAVQDWGGADIIACGLIGSAQGWGDTELAPAPTLARPRLIACEDAPLWICGGISQTQPPDIMRGDETRIAGFLAAQPEFDGVICLPGHPSRWVHISAGEICSFQSFLTAEIGASLIAGPGLRSVFTVDDTLPDGNQTEMWQPFDQAVADTLSRPERGYAALASISAHQALNGRDPASAYGRLWGILLGLELAAARPYWLGQEVAVIAQPDVARRTGRALAAQGVTPILADAGSATRTGLHLARQSR